MRLISQRQLILVIVFTVIEVATLTLWIEALLNPVIAIGILFVGLLLEHVIAIVDGNLGPDGSSEEETATEETGSIKLSLAGHYLEIGRNPAGEFFIAGGKETPDA